MEEHFTFGVHSLGLLEKCKASFEGEGCTCTVTVCTHTVGKMHFELHTLTCVRPPHPPVRFTPAKRPHGKSSEWLMEGTMTLANIVTAYEQYRQDVEASAKACVEEGGGIWVGIQDCAPYTDLVLFNSPETGSTLALKTTTITPELVASKIKNSNAQFRRAR